MSAAIFTSYSPQPLRAERRGGVTVEIGGIPILLETGDRNFRTLIEERYTGFLSRSATPAYHFEIQLEPSSVPSGEDVRVFKDGPVWRLERGDFCSEWDPRSRRGWVRQSANPYSIDAVLRIVHSLVLAEEGGFLVHAASGMRHGRAFLFAGISGAGKTTMARLAPADATVLTDEISYVRKGADGYQAYGTPFAGELARVGANVTAPLEALYFLEKGAEGRIEPISQAAAMRALLRHILFFAHERELVERVFRSAVEFVSRVTMGQFVFAPNERAWSLIR